MTVRLPLVTNSMDITRVEPRSSIDSIRNKIIEYGGEVRFLTRVEDLLFDQSGLKGVNTSSGFIPTSVVVLV